jgi:hypothetical protein
MDVKATINLENDETDNGGAISQLSMLTPNI